MGSSLSNCDEKHQNDLGSYLDERQTEAIKDPNYFPTDAQIYSDNQKKDPAHKQNNSKYDHHKNEPKQKISVKKYEAVDQKSKKIICKDHHVFEIQEIVYQVVPGTSGKQIIDKKLLNIKKGFLEETDIPVAPSVKPDDIKKAFDQQTTNFEESSECQCFEFINKCLVQAGRQI